MNDADGDFHLNYDYEMKQHLLYNIEAESEINNIKKKKKRALGIKMERKHLNERRKKKE